jgi:hypothetical protein
MEKKFIIHTLLMVHLQVEQTFNYPGGKVVHQHSLLLVHINNTEPALTFLHVLLEH